MGLNVGKLVQLLQSEIAKDPKVAVYMTPVFETLSQHGELLREIGNDVWEEVKGFIDNNEKKNAIAAIMRGLTPDELIAQIDGATQEIEAAREKEKRLWNVAESLTIAVLEFGGKLLLNSLLEEVQEFVPKFSNRKTSKRKKD